MGSLASVAVASGLFVGTHLLLSHPARAPTVRVLGEGGFAAVYSVVAAATIGLVVLAWKSTPAGGLAWLPGPVLWGVVTLVMLLASVLLAGSFRSNPAAPGQDRAALPPVRGAYAITRHPMMWSFALWGACHVLVYPVAKNVVVSAAIALLALAGSRLQDRKKRALQPGRWPEWEAGTSWWPFAAIAQGRASLRGFPGGTLAGGLAIWLVATWAHRPLSGWPAGIWRWVG